MPKRVEKTLMKASLKSFYRKRLVAIFKSGLKGEPILEALKDLEEDLIFASTEDMEKHLQKLPLLSLIPLMLLEFPAFFLLLVAPLLLNLLEALKT